MHGKMMAELWRSKHYVGVNHLLRVLNLIFVHKLHYPRIPDSFLEMEVDHDRVS